MPDAAILLTAIKLLRGGCSQHFRETAGEQEIGRQKWIRPTDLFIFRRDVYLPPRLDPRMIARDKYFIGTFSYRRYSYYNSVQRTARLPAHPHERIFI